MSFALCCTWNCYQHFPHEKMTLLRKEYRGLSFEEHNIYGTDIPTRFHVKGNMQQWKFITIQEIDICEMTWYKIISLSKSTYMLYKTNLKRGCKFLLRNNKVCINSELQSSRWSQMFNPWLTWLLTQCCINWKESKMVNMMFDDCYLICGRAFESKVMK